jgi:hypothetical protein
MTRKAVLRKNRKIARHLLRAVSVLVERFFRVLTGKLV